MTLLKCAAAAVLLAWSIGATCPAPAAEVVTQALKKKPAPPKIRPGAIWEKVNGQVYLQRKGSRVGLNGEREAREGDRAVTTRDASLSLGLLHESRVDVARNTVVGFSGAGAPLRLELGHLRCAAKAGSPLPPVDLPSGIQVRGRAQKEMRYEVVVSLAPSDAHFARELAHAGEAPKDVDALLAGLKSEMTAQNSYAQITVIAGEVEVKAPKLKGFGGMKLLPGDVVKVRGFTPDHAPLGAGVDEARKLAEALGFQ